MALLLTAMCCSPLPVEIWKAIRGFEVSFADSVFPYRVLQNIQLP